MAVMKQVDLDASLRDGESDTVERKRNAADLDRIREAICAFANDLPDRRRPGVIFIGVELDGSCADIAIDDPLLQRLAQVRDDGNLTPFPTMEVRGAEIDGCRMAVIIVQPSENPPVRCRGRAWIRIGPRRAIATPDEERRLVEKRRWATLPFDAQPVFGATLDDLDLVRFTIEYVPALVSPDTIAQNERTVEQQLRALRLVDVAGIPTATALLMLGKFPQHWFPGAAIEWRRVAGDNITDTTLDERVLTGTIPDQLRRIDEIVDLAISAGLEMGQTAHIRTSDYPLAALQQVIRNGVMHRTYEGTTSPCRVTWYSDRVEILSPGGPFGAVSVESFAQPGLTDYRNPTLAESLKGYGFVERFGQGLEIARRRLLQNGNLPLEFRFQPPESPAWVHVTIRGKS